MSTKADNRTDDGIDNEHGTARCGCGAVLNYTGWNAPETWGWIDAHDSCTGGLFINVTKDCSCGRGDHPQGCAPPGHWIELD